MINKMYHTFRTTDPKSNKHIRGKIDTPNTYIQDHLLSWLGAGTLIEMCMIPLTHIYKTTYSLGLLQAL
jgi:hypothetical protein